MHLQCALIILLGFLLHMGTSYDEASELPGPDVHLSFVSSCGNSATLYWIPPHNQKDSKLCELTVYKTGQLKAEIIDIYPDSQNHHIQLSNLEVGHSYSAFIVCDRTTKTNIIDFIFGKSCQDLNHSHEQHNKTLDSDNESNSVEILRSGEFSTVGLLSAVIFSCFGFILIVVVVYFIWKKYQHRQRILRIFRQDQNDPFQALYSPTQDAYSV